MSWLTWLGPIGTLIGLIKTYMALQDRRAEARVLQRPLRADEQDAFLRTRDSIKSLLFRALAVVAVPLAVVGWGSAWIQGKRAERATEAQNQAQEQLKVAGQQLAAYDAAVKQRDTALRLQADKTIECQTRWEQTSAICTRTIVKSGSRREAAIRADAARKRKAVDALPVAPVLDPRDKLLLIQAAAAADRAVAAASADRGSETAADPAAGDVPPSDPSPP